MIALVSLTTVTFVQLLLSVDDVKWDLDFHRVFEVYITRCQECFGKCCQCVALVEFKLAGKNVGQDQLS